MRKQPVSCIILLLCLRFAQAQCPPAAQVLNSLSAIQNSGSFSPDDKIGRLHRLRLAYLTCYKRKDSVYARIVHRLGDLYSKTNDPDRAIQYTREAIAINAGGAGYAERSFLAHSYLNMGLFYKWYYQPQQALLYFDSCISISKQFPEKYFILFLAFEEKVYALFEIGDFQKCNEAADDGILFARGLKDTLQEIRLLCRKAQAQVGLKNIKEAEPNIQKTIRFFGGNSRDTSQLAASYSIYANLLTEKGDFTSAINYHRRSFALNMTQGSWLECSRNMLNLGNVYDKNLKQYEKALTCYQKGLQVLKRSNDTYQQSALYINTGVVYSHKKEYIKAMQFYQKALNILPIGFTDTAVKSNPSVNRLKLVANDYFVSTLLANKAEALLDLYRVEKRMEWLRASLQTFQLADKSVDIMRWKQSGEQSKLFWREKTRSMYEHAVSVCYLLRDVENAFYFFEKSRAVLLNDKLSELGAKKFISPASALKEKQLRSRVFFLNQQLASLPESAALYSTTRRAVLSAQDQLEKFIKSLEKQFPVYYQYKYDNTVLPIRKIKNRLESDQSLVEYFTGDSAVYILCLTRLGDKFLKISINDYGPAAKELMKLCSGRSELNQNYARYSAVAFELYNRLFKPLQMPEGRVIISQDEDFIPFEALLCDAHNPGSFLLKKYAFSYTYSAGLLMRNAGDHSGNSFLGIAPVNYQSHLRQETLAGADESLQHIKPYFPSASFLLNTRATKRQFLKDVSLFDIVQVYSHADAGNSFIQPVLYLGDSSVSISEIQALEDVRTHLIVLSACRTGTGRNAKGEGVYSLARAFTAAGIPSTVTTLWQVENKATYQLTENFYKYLSQGIPKDVALQKAKLEFLSANDKTYELPYYWAAGIVLGNTDAVTGKAAKKGFPFIAIITPLLLLPLLFILFKRKPYNRI